MFKRGDRVSVIRRVSWRVPTKSNPNYKKDLVVGTEGIKEGWADDQARQVLLTVTLTIAGAEQTVTDVMYPKNLQLTSDYLLGKAGDPGEGEAPEEPEEPGPRGFKWLLGSSAPADLKVETNWKTLQADADVLARNMFLKGRIATGLEALHEKPKCLTVYVAFHPRAKARLVYRFF